MPQAALCGLRHSESDVYFVKSSAIGHLPSTIATSIERVTSMNRIRLRGFTIVELLVVIAIIAVLIEREAHRLLDGLAWGRVAMLAFMASTDMYHTRVATEI